MGYPPQKKTQTKQQQQQQQQQQQPQTPKQTNKQTTTTTTKQQPNKNNPQHVKISICTFCYIIRENVKCSPGATSSVTQRLGDFFICTFKAVFTFVNICFQIYVFLDANCVPLARGKKLNQIFVLMLLLLFFFKYSIL